MSRLPHLLAAVALLLAAALPSRALAWGTDGHMIVGIVAGVSGWANAVRPRRPETAPGATAWRPGRVGGRGPRGGAGRGLR